MIINKLFMVVFMLFVIMSCSSEKGSGGLSCSSAAVATSQQVANPISYLSTNNNGVSLQFPYVASNANNVTGYAVFGIGTQTNNTPGNGNIPASGNFNTLAADPNLTDTCYTQFETTWGGNTICGFFDSGSNSLSFPNLTAPSYTPISYDSNSSDYLYDSYTPSNSTAYTATNIGYGGSPSVSTSFNIENNTSLYSNNNVLSQLGSLDPAGPISGDFDWGLPFFLGRTIFLGLEGTSSTFGSGLYWSYPTGLNTNALITPNGVNVMPVTIGGYLNEPYVTVTVCVPGTSNCASIPYVLLDSGSSGLRLFSSAISTSVTNALAASSIGECQSYGDNSVQWGAIQTADVHLGQQTASSVPIQIINTSFGDGGASCYNGLAYIYLQEGYVSTTCPTSTTASQSQDPSSPYYGCPFFDSPSTYYNGILGVNFMAQDCGSACAENQTYLYYSCSN